MKEKSNNKPGKKNWKLKLVAVFASMAVALGFGGKKLIDGVNEIKEVGEAANNAVENADNAEVEADEYLKKFKEELERKNENNKVTIDDIKNLYCSEYNKKNEKGIDSTSIEIIEKWVDSEKIIAVRYETEGKDKKYIDACDSINKKIDIPAMNSLGISDKQNNTIIGKIPEGTGVSIADILQKYILMNEYSKDEEQLANYRRTRDELRQNMDNYKIAVIPKEETIKEEPNR